MSGEAERWRAHEAAVYAGVRDPRVIAVLDILAPAESSGERLPIFEWGHETTPSAEEMVDLAIRIVASI